MANLRDLGYPASTIMINPPIKGRTARQIDGEAEGLYKREIPIDSSEYAQKFPIVEIEPLLDDKQQAYVDAINTVLNAANVPAQVDHYGSFVRPDYYWGNYVDNMNAIDDPNGERLGFVHSVDYQDPSKADYYGAGIDNLNKILGDNEYYKELNLPLGITGQIEYDGDTLAGGLDIPSKQYYVAALLNLLNKKR